VPITPTPGLGRLDRSAQSRLDDADDGHVVVAAQRVQRDRRHSVARHDQQLRVVIGQQVGHLERVFGDITVGLGTVREAARIAEVHDGLVGKQVYERAQHCEATEPGVDHADR
jgi:rRNA processing protein Gar1